MSRRAAEPGEGDDGIHAVTLPRIGPPRRTLFRSCGYPTGQSWWAHRREVQVDSEEYGPIDLELLVRVPAGVLTERTSAPQVSLRGACVDESVFVGGDVLRRGLGLVTQFEDLRGEVAER